MSALKKIVLGASALAAVGVAALPGFASAGGAPAAAALPIAGSATGALAAGDARLDSGEYADTYRFAGRRGERVSLALGSSDFDAYLILRRPDGGQVDNDDRDSGSGTDSGIEAVLGADGTYEVVVTSYRPGETGRYRLALDRSGGAAADAGDRSGGRVFALIVGVSDYGGRANDLPDTDADAKALSEQLERVGALHGGSILLTNAEATRRAVEEAFARIAREAGPDDTFLFFFSGHGNQVKAAAPGELDGESETIELRDGPITDAELARLFGTLRTRLAIAAIDSCFSGGFDNLVSRPNVMGLFSSEEDLTSSVASHYDAGGYLAHFLQQGVGGAADEDGDGNLTAGELSAFLHRAFREEGDIPATTLDGRENYQYLVVARGGVRLDDVLFRLAAAPGRHGREDFAMQQARGK